MMVPVRCISCGRVIGQLWEKYRKKIESGEDPNRALDELGVKSYCCRATLISTIDMGKQLGKFKK